MSCPRSSGPRGNSRKARLAAIALVLALGVLALYGQRWVLRDAPASNVELVLAQRAASAIYGR
ncbi:MAG TPA: hypothetical protein VMV45_17040 [Casimicrobiaceae bacterium]|nr:hypothetical protein [Casimicrobiaceae bacterium]